MKGIKFNAEMVNAILEGRKTQTRRVIKPHIEVGDNWKLLKAEIRDNRINKIYEFIGYEILYGTQKGNQQFIVKCPFGKIGDKLFVKEDFAYAKDYKGDLGDAYLDYRATPKYSTGVWKSAHFMKQEQSRITLQITDIRVERLNDISEKDALYDVASTIPEREKGESYVGKFKELWNSIYKKDPIKSWKANPWVWVIDFEVK